MEGLCRSQGINMKTKARSERQKGAQVFNLEEQSQKRRSDFAKVIGLKATEKKWRMRSCRHCRELRGSFIAVYPLYQCWGFFFPQKKKKRFEKFEKKTQH